MLVTAGKVIEQLFGAFISWHTCTLKSRRRIASPEISTKRMSIFKLQPGMAGHKMVLRRSNMRKRMSALGHKRTLRRVQPMSALPLKADIQWRTGTGFFGYDGARWSSSLEEY